MLEIPSVKITKKCNHAEESKDPNEVGKNKHVTTIDKTRSFSTTEILTAIHETKEVIRESHDLCRHLASEVLVFLISDTDRVHEREKQFEVPVAYALKGYSLTSTVLREMIDKVLYKCFTTGLYVPAISFDGQWSKLSVRSKNDFPLTMLQLQKDVYKDAKSKDSKFILNLLANSNCVKAQTLAEICEQTLSDIKIDRNGKFISIDMYRSNECVHIWKTSATTNRLIKIEREKGDKSKRKESDTESTKLIVSKVLDELSPDDAINIQDDLLQRIETIRTDTSHSENLTEVDLSTLFTDEQSNQEIKDSCQSNPDILNRNEEVNNEQNHVISEENEMETQDTQWLNDSDKENMLEALKHHTKANVRKWENLSIEQFNSKLISESTIEQSFTKNELNVCLGTISSKLKESNIHFALSWQKQKIFSLMYNLTIGNLENAHSKTIRRKKSAMVVKLSKLCMQKIKKLSKNILSCIYAEYLYPDKLSEWQEQSPFAAQTNVHGIAQSLTWYLMPEYVPETFTYLFAFLDCHHLFVNARVKCFSTGIEDSGIKRKAWVKVAEKMRENKSGLSLALVNDLVDKQSNAFAQKTFSEEVESVMRVNGDIEEANFCKLIMEWYQAEDEPGIEVAERIKRRLVFRDWLLRDVRFNEFPPYGNFIKGIPHIMYEGILTNIERRIQITPYIKSGTFNPRSLGSLEAENFFGEFQELDPKGSGVIRPDDIPKAIQTACELIGTRRNPNRKFYMHTSKAKVYDVHELMETVEQKSAASLYITPSCVSQISPRNHYFDYAFRGNRKHAKRKSGEISQPAMPCRGAYPVRAFHKRNEEKVFADVKYGELITE